jgi:hypothetical protein
MRHPLPALDAVSSAPPPPHLPSSLPPCACATNLRSCDPRG